MKHVIREIELSELLDEKPSDDILDIIRFFNDFFNGLYSVTIKEFPNSIFFVKNINGEIKCYIEHVNNNDILWCDYIGVWSHLLEKRRYSYVEVQEITKYMVGKHLNIKVSTIYQSLGYNQKKVEEYCNNKK